VIINSKLVRGAVSAIAVGTLVVGMNACGPREKQKAKQTTTTPPKAPQTPAKK
jgi:hypothetical protein